LLLERGAKVQNLRTAAALGRTDLIESYFNADGSLKPEAGRIDWPFGSLDSIACSNHDAAGKQSLADRVNAWSQDSLRRRSSSGFPLMLSSASRNKDSPRACSSLEA